MVYVLIKKILKKVLLDMVEDFSMLKISLVFFMFDIYLKKMFFLYIDILYVNVSKFNSFKEM